MPDDHGPRRADAGVGNHTHHAGPFGFSRPEIIVLSVVALVVIALSSWQWMRNHSASQVPAWTVDDVLIDSLQTKSEFATSDEADHPTTDINTATRAELMRLPGIGATLADRIIASRERNGPFTNLVDFQRVNGIGPKKAAALAGWVRFSIAREGQ